MFAVDGPGKDFRGGCLAGSPGTAEKVCVGDSVTHNLIPQRLNHSPLPHDVGKILWPPLAV
jgi:hypothetical protein